MKIVSSVLPNDIIQSEIIREFPEADFSFFKGMKEAKKEFAEAEVFITYGNDLTAEQIEQASKLKWIMVMSAGVEEMPLQACKQKGIFITNARGIHKIPMAEFTMGLLLQYEKRMHDLWENEQKGKWYRRLPFGELYGKVLLIVGTGAIGSEIARLGKAFRMRTIGVNRSGNEVENIDVVYREKDIPSALAEADYVISVLPSTKATKNFFMEEHFKQMKQSAVFVNIGRGDVVDEHVLIQAIEKNQIAHAYLDVFENEPLPENHRLWNLDGVTVTPHVSSLGENYLPRAFHVFKQNLRAYINEKDSLKNLIDYEKGY